MTILIDSVEPRKVKDAFGEYAIDTPLEGFDFKMYTECGIVAIERKRIPGDFLSSLTDGRLYQQILAMRDSSNIQILLLEGRFRYNRDNILLRGRRKTRWNRKGITNLLRSIKWIEGVDIEYSSSISDTVITVLEIQDYFDKTDHTSLRGRPRIQTNWIKPTREEKIIYWIQGLPGVGVTTARKLYEKFPTPLLLFQASPSDIGSIPRIGKVVAMGIHDFLRTGVTSG